MRGRIGEFALVGLFLLVGALAWYLRLGPALRVDPAPLAALPHQLGPWQGADLSLDSGVEAILRADFNLQRAYVHPLGDTVWLYVGYYGTDRGGTPEHTPAVCYRSQGWEIEERRTLDVAPERGLRVNEYLVEKDGRRDLVHFWFRSHRRTGILGTPDRTLDHLIGRMFDRRADGSLVRISGIVDDGDVPAARSRLIAFAVRLDQELDSHWPNEIPTDAAAARDGARFEDSIPGAAARRPATMTQVDSAPMRLPGGR